MDSNQTLAKIFDAPLRSDLKLYDVAGQVLFPLYGEDNYPTSSQSFYLIQMNTPNTPNTHRVLGVRISIFPISEDRMCEYLRAALTFAVEQFDSQAHPLNDGDSLGVPITFTHKEIA